MPEINIPFPGFYESYLTDAVDRELEQFVENRCEEQAAEWPEPLRISESDMGELSWRPWRPYILAIATQAESQL